jgi:predicted RNase H-like nuclease
MDGGRPVLAPKRGARGSEERRALLARAGVLVPERPSGAAVDDLLDACALSWSAGRIARGEARRVPRVAGFDRRGLRMDVRW